jgi:hypothetical protein
MAVALAGRPLAIVGERGDGPLGVHASQFGPAAQHPTDAERSEAHYPLYFLK